jgi:V/A-type H+-transporting ATPase subunit E
MSLQAILDAIRASGAAQVSEIEKDAYIQSNQILADARMEAEQVKIDARAKAFSPAIKERARIIQQARQEALQIFGDAREVMVDSALDQIRGRLASIRTDPAYPQMLRTLLQEALTKLEESIEEICKAQLDADPRDQEILEVFLAEEELDLLITYDLKCWGGLIAKSPDGRVVVINTLDARLESARPYLRSYLAALFEGDLLELEPEQVEDAFVST